MSSTSGCTSGPPQICRSRAASAVTEVPEAFLLSPLRPNHVSVIHEPPVKKYLYWCDQCNVPLIGRTCSCGANGREIELLQPYDVRPALSADMALIKNLVRERFGNVPIPSVLLLNKTGGVDRADLVLAHGHRFGWLTFDPVTGNSPSILPPRRCRISSNT